MSDEPTRKGKIARLPLAVRSELNRRLREGESGATLLPWLNSLPAVLVVLDEQFSEQPISAQNLSEWRAGGYRDWLVKLEEIERIKELSDYALKLGQAAGGNITDGSAAIAGGRIMAELENASGEDLTKLTNCLSLLRSTDLEKKKVELRERRADQLDQQIELQEKIFMRKTCELFLKWYEDQKAKEVVEGRASNSEKIDKLGQLMFGEDWK